MSEHNTHEPIQNPEDIPTQEIIVPLEGLEDKTYSLPDVGEDGHAALTFKADWIMTDERFDEEKDDYMLAFSRYKEDGTVETRHEIPNALFESYQVDMDAKSRFNDAKEDLGAAAVQMQLIGMVRSIRDEDYRDGVVEAEQSALEEIKIRREKRREESLKRLEEHNNKLRRENPIKYLQRGKHHPKPFPDEQGDK